MRACTLILIAGLVAVTAAGGAFAGIADAEIWFAVEFSGTPVGVGRDRWVPADDGVFYESYVEIHALRLGAPIEFISRIEEWDDNSRILIRFESETSINGEWIRSSGEKHDGAVHITTSAAAFSQVDTLTWEADAVGMAWVDEEIRKALGAGAREFTIRTFDPRLAGFQSSRFVVSGKVPETGLLVVKQFDLGMDVPSAVLYLDEQFEIQRMESDQLNMTLSLQRMEAEEIAKLTLDPNFDMIREQMIPCLGYPGRPEDLDEVEFQLTFSRPFADASGFAGPNQRILSRAGETMELIVSREPVEIASGPGETRLGESTDTFLRPGRYVQSDDPAIRAVADSIAAVVGTSEDAIARAMLLWVGDYISQKSYGRGFSSASDVLRSRTGDCSEHSVLLAALLRAAGIPARITVGLAYDSGNLIGHMWTEAYIGRWVTLDALDPANDPKRIRIASSPDERVIDETNVVNAYSIVAGLEVEVTGYKPAAGSR